jgi:hypothetical protein
LKRHALVGFFGLALLACVALWTSVGYAATVALVRPPSRSPAVTEALFRLQGELLAVGLEVEVTERPASRGGGASDRRALLERMATERRLDAIIEVVGDGDVVSVDVLIFQRSPRRAELYRVAPEPGEPNRAEALAIRSIEVLRSSFLDLHLPPAPRRAKSDASPPPNAAKPAVPDSPDESTSAGTDARTLHLSERVALELGAGLLTRLSGVGPALLPVVRADWALYSPLVVQATLSGFGTKPTIETEVGSATVDQHYGLLGLCYCSPSATGLHPVVAFAAGALRTSFDGRAEAPQVGHHVTRWSLLLDGNVGARWRVSGQYFLTLAAHVQLAEPYVTVYFVNTRVATIDRPNLLFSLTVGAWL